MIRVLRQMIRIVLSVPSVFEWQQRACNDYGSVAREFEAELGDPPKTILEVGCATGVCAGEVFNMRHHDYHGIDIVPGYVERAAKLYPDGNFSCMDARDLRFSANMFDIVFFNGAMHHMADSTLRDCFRNVLRVLKDDGVVLLAEPVFTPGDWLSSLFLSLDRGDHVRDRRGYQVLFDGFEVVRQGYFSFSIHRCCSFVLQKEGSAR